MDALFRGKVSGRLSSPWIWAIVSAWLLDLPFPIAGPLPAWRGGVAWFALAPMLWGVLTICRDGRRRALFRSALGAYGCGVVWYLLNCYWIYATMHIYGGIGGLASVGILLLYSLVLGLYFGVFGFLVALMARTFGGLAAPLALAPVFWVALEFAASRITRVPWDQLGYSQVDNFVLTRLAPVTGVYGISFALVTGNCLLAAAMLVGRRRMRMRLAVGWAVFAGLLQAGMFLPPETAPVEATAVLLQQNLDVNTSNDWVGPEWERRTAEFVDLSLKACGDSLAGMPEPEPVLLKRDCGADGKIDLVAWPESPSPFREDDGRFVRLMKELTSKSGAVAVVGNVASWVRPDGQREIFNSAEFVGKNGSFAGRYDKIHLVPFGEYVPFHDLLSFAGTLTQGVGHFARGGLRKVFPLSGHRFGAFICYEAVFADEVRHFADNGAEVLVNISDDGWYGDTSAPWQHLNMARMRAIENDRWILRATNTGVTAAIDPQGRVTQSAPRHVLTSLAVRYGYRRRRTIYTRYGDVFAILCGIIAIIVAVTAGAGLLRRGSHDKSSE